MLAILAPGQGSQTPSMLTAWLEDAELKNLLTSYSSAINLDLERLGTVADADEIKLKSKNFLRDLEKGNLENDDGMIEIDFDTEDNRLFIVESRRPIYTPKRYRNWFGQLLEHAPFCERDIRQPYELETYNESGDFLIKVKKQNDIFDMVYASHPFDVVGYDGFNYPYAFSIHDFEPITGRIHQPPPVHQTFEAKNFVICSFVPRKYDYHPQAIPAPYNHSNVDSDEVLYYVDGDFMSRKSVVQGQITLHPGGIPHGPHPGSVEKSIGKEKTDELAVMIDPFRPLMITEEALLIEDENYHKSWQHNIE